MIFRNFLFSLISFSFTVFSSSSFSQNGITKNTHVKYDVEIEEGNYVIHYTFKDPTGNLQTYHLTMPVQSTHEMINKFGVPNWMFEPYVDTEYNKLLRFRELENGLFRLTENTIVVDKSAVIDFYGSSFCKPIAEMIVSSLNDYGMDNRLNRIQFAMRFVQEIPYGIPDYEDKDRHYGGVNIIPKLLIEGFGDCDSKVLLFAGIMVYLIPVEEFLFLNQSQHVLSAIKGEPQNGQTFIRYRGNKYLLAETAGPGIRLLGEKGKYFKDIFSPETLNINPVQVIPFSTNAQTGRFKPQHQTMPPNSIRVSNTGERSFRFQVSYDLISWETMNLQPNEIGNVQFDHAGKKYIRYRPKNANYETFEINTGMSLIADWNNRKRKWEVLLQNNQ
jgi:hypothetical protein